LRLKDVKKYKNQLIPFLPAEDWLIGLIFRDETEAWSDKFGDEGAMIEFALNHGLGQILYRSSVVDSLSEMGRNKLKKEYFSNLARNTALQIVGDEVLQKLRDRGIEAMFLKGSFLSRVVYKDPALRPMSDIDILVPTGKAEEAFMMLAPDLSVLKNMDKYAHHLPGFMYRGVLLEIHKSLFAVNLKYQIPIGIIWQKKEVIPDGGLDAMHPLHLLAHLLLHIYYSYRNGGLRLGWFYDLKLCFEYYQNRFTKEEIINFMSANDLLKPVSRVLGLLLFLWPQSYLGSDDFEVPDNDVLKMARFIKRRQGRQSDLKYGYSIAWERLKYSAGWKMRLAFMKYLVLVDKSGTHHHLLFRIWYLVKSSLRMLFYRMFGR
jgi:hypothetical protein